MDTLRAQQIGQARFDDWRALARELHARYLVEDFGAGARSVAAAGDAGDSLGHHPRAAAVATGARA